MLPGEESRREEESEEKLYDGLEEKAEQKVVQRLGLARLLRFAIWAVLIVGAGYVAVQQYLAPEKHPDFLTPGKYQIALKYNLTMEQVFMDDKPKGCDFSDDPPGDKHCALEIEARADGAGAGRFQTSGADSANFLRQAHFDDMASVGALE